MAIEIFEGKVREYESWEEKCERERKEKYELKKQRQREKRMQERLNDPEKYKSKNQSILYIQRLPDGLKEKLKQLAYTKRLSLNAYMIKVLQDLTA